VFMNNETKTFVNQVVSFVVSLPLFALIISCARTALEGMPRSVMSFEDSYYNWIHIFGLPFFLFLLPYPIIFYFLKKNENVDWLTKIAVSVSTPIAILDPVTEFYTHAYFFWVVVMACIGVWGLAWNKNSEKEWKADIGPFPLALNQEGTAGICTTSLNLNVQIVGGTGSGKSCFAIKPFIQQSIMQEIGCFIYDAKADLIRDVAYYWDHDRSVNHKEVFHFNLTNPDQSHTYNPLYGSNPDAIANRIHTALYYDTRHAEPFYVDLAKAFLQNLVGLLMHEIKTLTFMDLLLATEEAETFRTIQWFCAKYPDSDQARYFRNQWLWKNAKQRQEELSGLVTKLQRFCNSGWAHLLNVRDPDVVMARVVKDNRVFVFTPDAARYPEDAKPLSILAMMDLAEQSADRQFNKPDKPFRIFLDEFYNLAYPRFIDFINKCRQAEMNLFLAHQSIGDLTGVSQEFQEQVMNTARNKIILGIDDPETAEYFARQFGTEEDKDYQVESFDSAGALAGYAKPKVEKFRFHPNLIKELKVGEAVVKVVGSGAPKIFKIKLRSAVRVPENYYCKNALAPIHKKKGKNESSLAEVMQHKEGDGKKPGKNIDRLMGDKDAA